MIICKYSSELVHLYMYKYVALCKEAWFCENKGQTRCICEILCPQQQQSKKKLFLVQRSVKVTKSLTLVSLTCYTAKSATYHT